MDLLAGTLVLRPYVFAFVACFLAAGCADLGWRRTLLFGGLVWPVARLAAVSLAPPRPPLRPSPHGLPLVPVPRLRRLRPGARGARPPAPVAREARARHGAPDDGARRRHRPGGGAGRAVVPRARVLLPGGRRLLRGAALELRWLGAGGRARRGPLPGRGRRRGRRRGARGARDCGVP